MTALVMRIQVMKTVRIEMVENGNTASDLIHIAKNGTKYKYQKVPKVIRYVRYNQTKDPENYFREQLMLFMPWRNEQKTCLVLLEHTELITIP